MKANHAVIAGHTCRINTRYNYAVVSVRPADVTTDKGTYMAHASTLHHSNDIFKACKLANQAQRNAGVGMHVVVIAIGARNVLPNQGVVYSTSPTDKSWREEFFRITAPLMEQ